MDGCHRGEGRPFAALSRSSTGLVGVHGADHPLGRPRLDLIAIPVELSAHIRDELNDTFRRILAGGRVARPAGALPTTGGPSLSEKAFLAWRDACADRSSQGFFDVLAVPPRGQDRVPDRYSPAAGAAAVG